MQRRFVVPVAVLALATLVAAAPFPAAGQTPEEGPKVGGWKTWILSSGSEISVPAPPADDSEQTKAELAELRQLQTLRSPIGDRVIQFWNSGPATLPWTRVALQVPFQNGPRYDRALAHIHAAIHDAVVAAWHAKYTHNRKPRA
jgi:hypothetical protein